MGISVAIGSGSGIGIAKKFFCFQNFFGKTEHLYSFLCLVMVSVPFCNRYLLHIHPSKSAHWCSRKRLFEFSEGSVHWCFEKITSENFCILSSKTCRVESFLSTLAGLRGLLHKSCLKQLLCREPVSACFCKKQVDNAL